MPMWIVMRDGDCLAHRFYSENIDTASREAKIYANKLGINTNWVCTLLKNRENFHYDYIHKKWVKCKIDSPVEVKLISKKSNKKHKSDRRRQEEEDLYNYNYKLKCNNI